MIAALGLTGRLFTLGAMHAQKNSRQPWPPVTICWFNLKTIKSICSMPPTPSLRAPSQPTPPLQLPSADPATSGAASHSTRYASMACPPSDAGGVNVTSTVVPEEAFSETAEGALGA